MNLPGAGPLEEQQAVGSGPARHWTPSLARLAAALLLAPWVGSLLLTASQATHSYSRWVWQGWTVQDMLRWSAQGLLANTLLCYLLFGLPWMIWLLICRRAHVRSVAWFAAAGLGEAMAVAWWVQRRPGWQENWISTPTILLFFLLPALAAWAVLYLPAVLTAAQSTNS